MPTINSNKSMGRVPVFGFSLAIVFALATWCAGRAEAQSTTFPPPVVATSTTAIASGLNQPQGVAVDSTGNVFVANASAGSVIEIPVNGGAQVTVISGLSYNKGMAVDSFGNAYSTSYGGSIAQWKAGGAANSGATFTSGSSCPDFAAMGYYIGFQDVGADGQGNIYALGQGKSYIMEFDQKANCTERLTPTQLGSNVPGSIAADTVGDIYYTVGNSIYYLPVGSTTPTLVALSSNAVQSINGLHVDSKGDLFITDSNSIDEIPFVNGALAPAKIAYIVPAGAPYEIGVDTAGALYYPNFNANIVVKTLVGSLSLGASATGKAGTAGVITYTFNAPETPTSFSFVSGSGTTTQFAVVAPGTASTTTCATGTAYPASSQGAPSICTLNVVATPAAPGEVSGAVLFKTAAATLATTFLSAVGQGAGLTVDPGTQTAIGTFTTPTAIATDGSGNVFVADSSKGTVTEYPTGGGAAIAVATGLNAPQGLAVDPAGDLFIADTGNNQIVEVPVVAGALSTAGKTVVASQLSTPLGLATDIYGNLLIANSGVSNVLELPNQGGAVGLLPTFAIGSGFKKPTAIAVDASDNIFVSDATLAAVIKLAPGAAPVNVLADSQIAGIAVDANDDIFLTQTGVATVTKVPFASGAYSTNATVAVGTGLTGPQGIALDAAGNLYVADAGGGAAYKIQRTLGALTFGKVNVGTSSAAQTLSLSNTGNQGLTFGTPLYTTSGNTGDFTVAASANNGCAATLATGVSCGVSATFNPTASGTRMETLAFQSNAANASPVAATLSGTGASSVPTTLTLTVSPTGQIAFGQTVTVTATVAPKTASASTPTGTVQFSVDGVNYGTPVTLSSSGTAPVAISGLSGGAHVINATYSGDSVFASSAATAPLNLTISTAPTTTTLKATISASTAVATGTSVTFTATVTPTSLTPPPYPSGSVSFFAPGSTTAIGTAPLTNGVATFTTTALPNGQYNVTAQYSGDADFSASTSAGYAIYVSPPTFVFSNLPTTVSAPTRGSGSTSFNVTPIAGYTGTVFFSCSGLPLYSTCTFTPGGVDFTIASTTQNVQLTVNTGVANANFAGSWVWPGLLALGGLMLFARRKGAPRLLMVVFLLAGGAVASLSLTGCSSDSSTNVSTPTGSSNVTVNMVGSSAPNGQTINQSFSFTLQVH